MDFASALPTRELNLTWYTNAAIVHLTYIRCTIQGLLT